ncbi:DUF47 domain-containing protein [Fredinandcohnia quinoae]|uniref:DUF47 domain-containing protein n=1 Tax=Fredinandcohnia quinoae TaxID=2918902 RepID=A0AAW5E2D5_9BACI|nr:DUF47 domain-containing protein [Fredinandcohnia sp. SECRCQ15]MCH1627061.1 DUF47 domain-containing protein [Fredinandcohnia sp. SECRCQ15]
MFTNKKKDPFFEMLSAISANVKDAADYFVQYKIKNVSDLKEFSVEMKRYENKGDDIIHELIVALNKSFITPIEREDILELAMKMDDVLDGMEQCVARFEMYSFTETDEYMTTYADYIHKCSIEIYEAIELLSSKKLLDMRKHTIKINEYESNCDELLRVSIKQLFAKEKDPIKIIQLKELYEILEEISDFCEDVADTLETIIMRNA